VIIEVMQDDIDKGRPKDECRCPVARAIRRCGPCKRGVEVRWAYIRVGSREYQTPDVVRRFMYDFDRRNGVAPFAFRLPIEEVPR
jgi:hypothetical protein